MGLLGADLRALANLPFTPAGRKQLIGHTTMLTLLAVMSWLGFQEVVARPELQLQLRLGGGRDGWRSLLGFALMPCPITATWLGLALAQKQLFEAAELPLWQQAPLPPWRPALQVWLRASFVALLWAAALAGPMVAILLRARANVPASAWALVPVAFAVATLPLITSLLTAQIVLARFFAGRFLRFLLATASALAWAGVSIWFLVGLFTPPRERLRELASADPAAAPWTMDTAIDLIDHAARGEIAWGGLAGALGWLGAAFVLFLAVARLHPAAVERHRLGERPLLRSRRRWPAGVSATIRRKELAQVLQQPGALLGFLAFAVLVDTLVRRRLLVGSILGNTDLSPDLRHLGALLVLWFLAVLLVLYAHMGRLAMWDGPQWSLYTLAPARPAAILWGKLQAIALFLLWPLVLVGAAGAHLLDASPTALVVFVLLALAGTLSALGVVAAVGTWPRLMRPDDGGQIAQGGRSFVAAMVLVLLFELVMTPAILFWWWLTDKLQYRPVRTDELLPYAPWLVAAAWAVGLATAGLGVGIGARNFGRLSRPH